MKKLLLFLSFLIFLFSGITSAQDWEFNNDRVVLQGTGTLAGVVTDATTGDPISGATVTANPGSYTTTTSSNPFAEENYTLSALPAGTYTVSVSAAGYETKTETGVQVTEGNTTTLDFALTPSAGETEKKIQVTLSPANGTVNETVTVTAIGPENNLYYKFAYTTNSYCTSPSNKGWVIGDWTPNNTFTWTPTSAGEYILVVWFNHEPTDPTCPQQMGMTYWVEEGGEGQ